MATTDALAAAEYERRIRAHYATVIAPDLDANASMDARLFRIAFLCSVVLLAWIAWHAPDAPLANLAKVVAGVFAWSFLFLCLHVGQHVHMWTHRGSFDQQTFAFYHHYVDHFMYSRHRERFEASHLRAVAFVVVPAMYVDNVLGATLLVTGATDMLAHRWYHTRRRDRRRQFHPVAFLALTALERLGVVDTRAHLAIHHGHDMHHLDHVEGWMDVRWPVAGRLCDALGGGLYRAFRDVPAGYHLMTVLAFVPLAVAWYVLDGHAFRDASPQAVAFHALVLAFLAVLEPPRTARRTLPSMRG